MRTRSLQSADESSEPFANSPCAIVPLSSARGRYPSASGAAPAEPGRPFHPGADEAQRLARDIPPEVRHGQRGEPRLRHGLLLHGTQRSRRAAPPARPTGQSDCAVGRCETAPRSTRVDESWHEGRESVMGSSENPAPHHETPAFGNPDLPPEGMVNTIGDPAGTRRTGAAKPGAGKPVPQRDHRDGDWDISTQPFFWSSFNISPRRQQRGGWARGHAGRKAPVCRNSSCSPEAMLSLVSNTAVPSGRSSRPSPEGQRTSDFPDVVPA